MKHRYYYTMITLAFFSSIPSIATELMQGRSDDMFKGESYTTNRLTRSSSTSPRLESEFSTLEEFTVAGGKLVKLKLPLGIEVPKEFFNKYNVKDVPYVLDQEATRLFNKEDDKEKAALFTIASLWAGNKDGNFISDLDFTYEGIVGEIRKIDSLSKLQSAIRRLKE